MRTIRPMPAQRAASRTFRVHLIALAVGLLAAAVPGIAVAQSRELDTSDDAIGVIAITALAILGLLLVAGIGYMYRRERGLEWDFQKPDEPVHHD